MPRGLQCVVMIPKHEYFPLGLVGINPASCFCLFRHIYSHSMARITCFYRVSLRRTSKPEVISVRLRHALLTMLSAALLFCGGSPSLAGKLHVWTSDASGLNTHSVWYDD